VKPYQYVEKDIAIVFCERIVKGKTNFARRHVLFVTDLG